MSMRSETKAARFLFEDWFETPRRKRTRRFKRMARRHDRRTAKINVHQKWA